MPYQYKATADFWKDLRGLSTSRRRAAQRIWEIFRVDPFDPRLGTHKIRRLSAHYQRTVYAVRIEADLRVLFFIRDDQVWSVAIGTHDLYKS